MKTKVEPFKRSIEVWNIHLSDHRGDVDLCRDLLTGEELGRAAKFLKPADAEGFILGRGLLRRVLADCLNREPSALRFNRNAQGKPFLEGRELEFNVSHSRDRLLIAVTAGRAVGVDIEFRRDGLNMKSIAKRWFSPEEQTFFQRLENPADGFFEIWAKKEAYVKALGVGIYKDLNTFAVPLGEPPFFPILGSDKQWFFQTLEIDSGYAAAVVSEAPPVPVTLRNF
ncbi:MAG: 4'-phosphopantetheinyl transferase superfamily protein [Kiritimatiellaceae bacterium]|nr:4'-phosphopantetheinyl transferase superfamily protein [Kiritimatiellaceae bacterium]